MTAIDLTGKKFGMLTALYPVGGVPRKGVLWHCQCECGNTIDLPRKNLFEMAHPSCGCLDEARLRSAGLRCCKFQPDGVQCYITDNCASCGWNPVVMARRKKGISQPVKARPNSDIRRKARDEKVLMTQLAAAMGICPSALRARLRKKLSQEDHDKILRLIDQIAKENRLHNEGGKKA